jgi:hypothetical protein
MEFHSLFMMFTKLFATQTNINLVKKHKNTNKLMCESRLETSQYDLVINLIIHSFVNFFVCVDTESNRDITEQRGREVGNECKSPTE